MVPAVKYNVEKRTSVKRYSCEEVQGEDSFVVVSSVKVSEIRSLRKDQLAGDVNTFDTSLQVLSNHILTWNWVDDDDKPLPTPKEDPNVIDRLTEEEAVFLVMLLTGEGKAKN